MKTLIDGLIKEMIVEYRQAMNAQWQPLFSDAAIAANTRKKEAMRYKEGADILRRALLHATSDTEHLAVRWYAQRLTEIHGSTVARLYV